MNVPEQKVPREDCGLDGVAARGDRSSPHSGQARWSAEPDIQSVPCIDNDELAVLLTPIEAHGFSPLNTLRQFTTFIYSSSHLFALRLNQ